MQVQCFGNPHNPDKPWEIKPVIALSGEGDVISVQDWKLVRSQVSIMKRIVRNWTGLGQLKDSLEKSALKFLDLKYDDLIKQNDPHSVKQQVLLVLGGCSVTQAVTKPKDPDTKATRYQAILSSHKFFADAVEPIPGSLAKYMEQYVADGAEADE